MEEIGLLEENEKESNQETGDIAKRTKTQILTGFFNAFGFVIFMVLCAVCVSRLNRSIGDFQLTLFRNGLGLVVLVCVFVYQRKLPAVPRCHIRTIIVYAFISNSTIGVYIAVTWLPASSVQCISITSGIVSGIFLYAILLNEKITVKNIICALLCICGVLLVLQPGLLFAKTAQNCWQNTVNNRTNICDSTTTIDIGDYKTDSTNIILIAIAYLLPVATGIMLTGEALLIKKNCFVMENFIVVYILVLHNVLCSMCHTHGFI